MTADSGRRSRATPLTDRHAECGALDRLVDAVRAGESRALVVRGDPGVGKTALLGYLTGRAASQGCRVERAAGVQSEMELAFAGLHQLCAPMLDRTDRLPGPQRDALWTALGVATGAPPDRFLVGLAVLSLLSEAAGQYPLICLIDDAQWLDQASAQALGCAARRLAADPVGLVFAAREPGAELTGLPELDVAGLQEEDARALLESALTGPLDARVRDLIVAETHGNPLALLELPRGLTPAQLAGGFGDAVCEATGAIRVALIATMFLGALRGHEAEVTPLIEATLAAAEAGGQGSAVTGAHWAAAVLRNGLGRYADALAAAEEATRDAQVFVSILVVPELVEAAARTGNTDVAAAALRRLEETTQPSGNDLALGIEARARALLSEGETAERLYQEAVDRLGRTQLRPDLARAHLLYGEWLRRQSRRLDARRQLRTAYDMLTAIGMEAFAERARRELVATGEQVRRRTDENPDQLTAQETLIARLARDGLSNAEIGAQLFISSRTVEWHLRKVFAKLGVSSRGQVQRALAEQNRPETGI